MPNFFMLLLVIIKVISVLSIMCMNLKCYDKNK